MKEHKLRFFNKVASYSPCCLSLIPTFCEAYSTKQIIPSLPPSLSASHDPRNEELTFRELLNAAENFVFDLTLKHITDVEQATKAQRKCDAWYSFRADQVTASKMKSVCRIDPGTPSVSLIKHIRHPQMFRFTTAATKWGCDNKAVARKFYYECMEYSHSKYCCQESGLRIHEEYQFLAATPDGIIECECCGPRCFGD